MLSLHYYCCVLLFINRPGQCRLFLTIWLVDALDDGIGAMIILTGQGGLSREIPIPRSIVVPELARAQYWPRDWYFPGKPDKPVSVIFIDRPGQYRQTLEMIMFSKIKYLYWRQCYVTSMQVPGFTSLCSLSSCVEKLLLLREIWRFAILLRC